MDQRMLCESESEIIKTRNAQLFWIPCVSDVIRTNGKSKYVFKYILFIYCCSNVERNNIKWLTRYITSEEKRLSCNCSC